MILKNHMETCVKSAAMSKDEEEIDQKFKEIENVITYLNKNL
jgi:DNA-binding FrmR family transcriptional regulator